MPIFLDTLITQALVLSFFGTAALTGLIFIIGRKKSGLFLASSSVGVGFIWFSAFILGTPDFPPEYNSTAILSASASLLVIGILIDYLLVERKKIYRPLVILINLLIGVSITVWMRSGFDLWSIPILLGWCVIAFGLQRISTDQQFGSGESTLILIIASFGTGIIAWLSDIVVDRDLAYGLCAISCGFFIFNYPKSRLYFGYSILLTGGGSLYMIAIRLVEQMPPLIPSFIILGFIFFVDVAGKYVQKNLPQLSLITVSAKLISLSLFPLALATVITLVAIEFPIN